ncbi:DUF2254 domain-containing protein [Sphingomonas rubra]|uniref:Uncharacterized membrane protein n=1 Tax=Sphingomonas rubra TaxID=634430 RepID=A0A1I5Q1W9_9SPHN|nr:DUF2254 domain-containing protein [Sphingomonas rubra]SFP40212.1 Uncharacterized membrane protein [Sphingomonas rubra]
MWLKARALELIEDIRGSYWFVPSLLAMLGFAAGLGLVYLDAVFGDAWLGRFEWFYGSRPDGARSLLSTVAGSTITVAGVVFSITLAAVTYASGQYGPRLLSNFVRDRGNQATLGVFIGTFLYCLVVLRTIRSAEETSADTGGAVREAFVPHIAMFGALALAVASIGVLIYFVHHVTDAIHINNVIARIGHSLLADIAGRSGEEAATGNDGVEAPPLQQGSPVAATRTGYVEALDEGALLTIAAERDAVITVLAVPGDFVHRGRPVLLIEPAGDSEFDGCGELFSVSRKRSALQDLRFPIDELVELAARALSPGINDPFTAIACIDWLGAALMDLSKMPVKPTILRDGSGHVRVVVPRLGFADFLQSAVGQLRPYAVEDPNTGPHLLHTLGKVGDALTDPRHKALLDAERVHVERAMEQKEN